MSSKSTEKFAGKKLEGFTYSKTVTLKKERVIQNLEVSGFYSHTKFDRNRFVNVRTLANIVVILFCFGWLVCSLP